MKDEFLNFWKLYFAQESKEMEGFFFSQEYWVWFGEHSLDSHHFLHKSQGSRSKHYVSSLPELAKKSHPAGRMLPRSVAHLEESEGAGARGSGSSSSLQPPEIRAEGRGRDQKGKGSRKRMEKEKEDKVGKQNKFPRANKGLGVVQMTGIQALWRELRNPENKHHKDSIRENILFF